MLLWVGVISDDNLTTVSTSRDSSCVITNCDLTSWSIANNVAEIVIWTNIWLSKSLVWWESAFYSWSSLNRSSMITNCDLGSSSVGNDVSKAIWWTYIWCSIVLNNILSLRSIHFIESWLYLQVVSVNGVAISCNHASALSTGTEWSDLNALLNEWLLLH